ncbi:MAG: PKD domain-containing protein [Bacteroidia bacterium]
MNTKNITCQLKLSIWLFLLAFLPSVSSNAQLCNPEFDAYKSGLYTEFYNKTAGQIPGIGWYNWDFGDGTKAEFSTDKVVWHYYQNSGTYTVCLTDSFCSGTNRTSCQQITLSATKAITAAMNIIPDSSGLYTFQDVSIPQGAVYRRLWNFGDGEFKDGLATEQFRFKKPGVYQVCLAVYDTAKNFDYYCEAINVVMNNYCYSQFEYNYFSGTDIGFVNQSFSTDPNVSYTWDFGDSNTSNLQNPRHVYTNQGMYTVKLMMNGTCRDTFISYVRTFDTTECHVRFTPTITNQKVNFVIYDNNPSPFASYTFDFGDNNMAWHTMDNSVNHTYQDTGTYTVCITAEGGTCPIQLSYCEQIRITSMVPICEVDFKTHSVENTLYLFVSNTSSGTSGSKEVSIDWGDGSTYKGPDSIYFTHTYTNPGIYFVSLIYTVGGQCADTSSQLVGVGALQKLSGKVMAGNSAAVNAGVLIYAYEPVSGTLNFYQYAVTNDSGYYEVELVPGYYLAQANFAFDPFQNQNYIPTYYPSALNWDDALVITLLGPRDDINIQLKTFYDLGNGLGKVSGKVYYGLGNKNETGEISYGTPVNKMLIYLLNEQGKVVSYTHSHANGSYSFSNLPEGKYTVWGEMAGRVTLAPEIAIASTNTDFGNIDIVVGKNFVSTGIKDEMELLSESLQVFPNPAQDKVVVQFGNVSAKINTIQVYDISGALIKQVNKNEIESDGSIYIQDIQGGLYIIRVTTEDGKQFNKKLQKL